MRSDVGVLVFAAIIAIGSCSAFARAIALGTNHNDNQSLRNARELLSKEGHASSDTVESSAGQSWMSARARMLQQSEDPQLGNVQYTEVYGGTSAKKLNLFGPSSCPGNSFAGAVYLKTENTKNGRLTGISLFCNDVERSALYLFTAAYRAPVDVSERTSSEQGFNAVSVYAGEVTGQSDIVSGLTVGSGIASLSGGSANGLNGTATAPLVYDIPSDAVIVGFGGKYSNYFDSLYFTYKTPGSADSDAPPAEIPFSTPNQTTASTKSLGPVQYTETYGSSGDALNIFGPTICPGESFATEIFLQQDSLKRLTSMELSCNDVGQTVIEWSASNAAAGDTYNRVFSDEGYNSAAASAYGNGTDGQSGIISGLTFSSASAVSANSLPSGFLFTIPTDSVIVGVGGKSADFFNTIVFAYRELL